MSGPCPRRMVDSTCSPWRELYGVGQSPSQGSCQQPFGGSTVAVPGPLLYRVSPWPCHRWPCLTRTVTIAAMSLSNLHPDFRLGLLLAVAALLLARGSFGTVWALLASDRLGPTSVQYGLLTAAFGLGGLFVVAAAIWVDRRPPHGMMGTGALVLALGLVLVTLFHGFWVALAGMFLVGAGGAFVGSLVFYTVALKGYRRFRGVLIGVLGMVFSVRLEDLAFALGWGGWASADEATGLGIGWSAVVLVLAAGISLFLLLPRWFTGTYGPGPTLREALAVPGVKARVLWVAAVYVVSAMTTGAGTTPNRWVNLAMRPDFAYPEFGGLALVLAGGAGTLAWGVASDFFPVRRLLIALAVLSLTAPGWGWLLDDRAAGALLLSLVRGGLISLPWVLMADLLPGRHLAKLALAITWVAVFAGSVGNFYWTSANYVWGVNSLFWIGLAETALMVAVVAFPPRTLKTVG